MANWIDTIVVIIVAGAGIAIFYRALKEPVDLLFGVIKRALVSTKDKIVDAGEGETMRVIRYD